jgi:hypothetical protein
MMEAWFAMTDSDEFLSIADAAKLLFVSRPHVLKLLEQGELELHHKAEDALFVTLASVLRYQSERAAAVRTYLDFPKNED